MSIGYPLPKDLCPENEYEAWYHAINALVNFVTSMSHLAGCYSSHLQNYQNEVDLSRNGSVQNKEELNQNGAQANQQPKLLSKLYDIMEEMPVIEYPYSLPPSELSEMPRSFTLVDTPDFEKPNENVNETKKTTLVTLVKSKEYHEVSSSLNCATENSVLVTSRDTLKSERDFLSSEDVNLCKKQFTKTQSNESCFTEFSDSNQTIDSLNMQENYEFFENELKVGKQENPNNQSKKVKNTVILEKCSQEDISCDLNRDEFNKKLYKKGEDLIESNLEALKKLQKELLKFSKSQDIFETKPQMEQIQTEPKFAETPLIVPDCAKHPVSKPILDLNQNSLHETLSLVLNKSEHELHTSKNQNFCQETDIGVKQQVVKIKTLNPSLIDSKEKQKDVKISRATRDNMMPKATVITKTSPKNTPQYVNRNYNITSKGMNNIKPKVVNEIKVTVANRVTKQTLTAKTVCPRHGPNHVCNKKQPLEKIEELPKSNRTSLAKKPFYPSGSSVAKKPLSPKETTLIKRNSFSNGSKPSVPPQSCPDLDFIKVPNESQKTMPKEKSQTKPKGSTSIPIRTINKNVVQPRTVSVDRVLPNKYALNQKIPEKTLSESQKPVAYLNRAARKVPLITNTTVKLVKEINRKGYPKLEGNKDHKNYLGKVPLKTEVTMKMIDQISNKNDLQTAPTTANSTNPEADKMLLRNAAAENLLRAEKLLLEQKAKNVV